MLLKRRPTNIWALGPFGELQDEFDRFFGDFWGEGRPHAMSYRMDVHEDVDHVYIDAELPGLTKDDLEITLEDGVLTVSGEKKFARDEDKEDCHVRERRYGSFKRSFRLPTVVDENKVEAVLKDGVLKVTLDKREEVKPKRIDVKVT